MDQTLTKNPFVTVLLPVFNGERTIAEAINSILQQTYTHFELVIIDDASSDNSARIISSFEDNRILYVRNQMNLKLIQTLNLGIKKSSGKYIVRMDADDISELNRIETLVNFMENHPEVIVCGSAFETFGAKKELIRHILFDEEIRVALAFYNPICHPSTIWRNELIKKHGIQFNPIAIHAEDYQFWIDCAAFGQLANLETNLLRYRIHEGQISSQHNSVQQQTAFHIKTNYLRSQLNLPDELDLSIWKNIIATGHNHLNYGNELLDFLNSLLNHFETSPKWNTSIFIRKIKPHYYNVLYQVKSIDWRTFKMIAFGKMKLPTMKERFYFLTKLKW